ncbi:hypothetical protein VitviT2T_021425 [Vitis vinifera]|uniref:Small ribosomal subunit protein bS18c n=1 Tax=Vitis vinifera TaxID=29760 RepID=A0ABY9D6X4_VITVI|nr:hypothetical protein VitviT2T_021425 [Vitis vinifera]
MFPNLLTNQSVNGTSKCRTSLISRFISEQGKILSRRVNRLTLKQQRLITIAIKQARILSSLPFLNNETGPKTGGSLEEMGRPRSCRSGRG